MSDVSAEEVYNSYEYLQYRLILDEHAAFHYARQEILAARERESQPAELPPFQDWYRQYLQSPEWHARADAAKERAGGRCEM